MKKFRITKYNPSFRNERGEYILDEWTSFSDIGKKFHNGVLGEKEYYETEDKYIQAINYILDEKNVFQMRVVQLEKYDNELSIPLSSYDRIVKDGLNTNSIVGRAEIEILSKMILRELLWASIQSIDALTIIEFGYDYYMYIRCNEISSSIKQMIFDLGLYIELLL